MSLASVNKDRPLDAHGMVAANKTIGQGGFQEVEQMALFRDMVCYQLELPSNEAIRAAIEGGDCATAISDLVVAHSLSARTLHHVEINLPKRSFLVLRHKERYESRAEKALLSKFGIA